MLDSVRPRRSLVAWLACLVSLAPAAGSASDGVIELNQTCATLSGCTPSDAAGFPITLDTRGSYRLTSVLEVPDENTNGIEISGDDINIDFNGFTLFGPNFVPISTHVCSLPGTGTGILATGAAAGFVAQNGRVRGMGKDGINVAAQNGRVERMIVERNCGHAITTGVAGFVIDSQVRANAGNGIVVDTGSRVRDSVAEQNNEAGILARSGSVVTGCVASLNGTSGIEVRPTGGVVMGNSAVSNGWSISQDGIRVPNGGVALHNSASANTGGGIDAGTTAGVGQNSSGGNTGAEFSGGVTIGCNVADGVPICP